MAINNYIPPVKELWEVADELYPTGHRDSVQNWTNCSWEMINYIRKWKNIKLFAKKSFLRWDIKEYENEYKVIKERFKNIVPNQWFVPFWNDIFVFCAPISIKVDVLLPENREYLVELIKMRPKLLKQFKFFIREFKKLLDEGEILDLYWTENLVISDDDKLYYIDSFLVFNKSRSVQEWSIENISVLDKLISDIEKEALV